MRFEWSGRRRGGVFPTGGKGNQGGVRGEAGVALEMAGVGSEVQAPGVGSGRSYLGDEAEAAPGGARRSGGPRLPQLPPAPSHPRALGALRCFVIFNLLILLLDWSQLSCDTE